MRLEEWDANRAIPSIEESIVDSPRAAWRGDAIQKPAYREIEHSTSAPGSAEETPESTMALTKSDLLPKSELISSSLIDLRLVIIRGCALCDMGHFRMARQLLMPIHAFSNALLAARFPLPRRAERTQKRGAETISGTATKRARGISQNEELDEQPAAAEGPGAFETETMDVDEGGGEEVGEELDASVSGRADRAEGVSSLALGGGLSSGGASSKVRRGKGADGGAWWDAFSGEHYAWITLRLAAAVSALDGAAAAYKLVQGTVQLLLRQTSWPRIVRLEPALLHELRFRCAQLAFLSGELPTAYDHCRALCIQIPGSTAAWSLYSAVLGRARFKRPDERWVLRAALREPDSAPITLAVAHMCLLSRSFSMAVAEYLQLMQRHPEEPLIRLCIGAGLIQTVSSRKNPHQPHTALVGFSALSEYARLRSHEQEVEYNLGRACHQLGLLHLAVTHYARALLHTPSTSATAMPPPPKPPAQDLTREAAHNLVRIFSCSGNKHLGRQVTRAFMRV